MCFPRQSTEGKEQGGDDSKAEKEDGEEDEEVVVDKPADEELPQDTLKYARGRNSGYYICIQVSSYCISLGGKL